MTIRMLLLILITGLTGCTGEARPNLVPVTGLVTLDDQPVEGALITFYPENGRPATGQTDPDGIYRLTTYEQYDGAVAGKHTVTISKQQNVPLGNTPDELKQIVQVIPEKFGSSSTSGLTTEIRPDLDAPIDFHLTN